MAFAGALNVLKIGALAGAGAMKILRLALISTGIGALIVGIGLAAAFVIQNWDKVKAFFGSIWESVKPYWEATTQFLGSIWQGFSAFLMGIFSPVVAVWNTIFNPVIAVWNGVFGGFFEWVSAKFAWITQMVSSVFSAVEKVLGFGEDKKMEIAPKVPQNSLIASALSGERYDKEALISKSHQTPQPPAVQNTEIVINLNGGFNIATSDGKFDLKEFENQIIASVQRAIKTQEFNAKNRSIIG